MYHSLYFTTEDNEDWDDYNPQNPSASIYNTFGSWGLIATERPVISMPPVKTNFTEQDYVSGSIDNTTTLTRVPVYGDRTGSITFYVTEPENWPDTLLNLAGYLHGKRLKMWLEDDPEYYYLGRWAINQWGSSEKFSTIQLDYTLYPYKISKLTTLADNDDWIWDDFNFDNGYILKNLYYFNYAPDTPEDILTPPSTWELLHTWNGSNNFSKVSRNLTQGHATPLVTVSDILFGYSTIDLRFVNRELGIDTTATLVSGTSMRGDFVFSNLSNTNKIDVYIKSYGAKVGFNMRRFMF